MPTNTITNTVLDSSEARDRNLPIIGNTVSTQVLKTLHFCCSKVNSDILSAAYAGKTEISYTRSYIEEQLGLDLNVFCSFLISRGYDIYATDVHNLSLNASNESGLNSINFFKFGKIGYSLVDKSYVDEDTGETDVPENRRYLPKFSYGVYPSGSSSKYVTLYDAKTTVGDTHSLATSMDENGVVISSRYLDYIYYININFGNFSKSGIPMQYSLVIA